MNFYREAYAKNKFQRIPLRGQRSCNHTILDIYNKVRYNSPKQQQLQDKSYNNLLFPAITPGIIRKNRLGPGKKKVKLVASYGQLR
jgi:hypothetical protein